MVGVVAVFVVVGSDFMVGRPVTEAKVVGVEMTVELPGLTELTGHPELADETSSNSSSPHPPPHVS